MTNTMILAIDIQLNPTLHITVMHCSYYNELILVPRRDAETAEFIEDLQAQIRELVKANEALKNKVF